MHQQNPHCINTADIIWQTDDLGQAVPISSMFGDVYFSKTDGLAESRYVFLQHNQLAQRFSTLADYETFTIGEIGFGTGLNILATWQLWQQVRPDNHSRLHIITTEKFPLCQTDLQRALDCWQELTPLAKQLLANYPPPLAGCHRLNFFADRLTLDIWLGDATDSLAQITGNSHINAWFLDGFAPACNHELWAEQLFQQLQRLSGENTTLSTFSVASVVKHGLTHHGFSVKKVKGFGKKREMLTAVFLANIQENLPIELNKKPQYIHKYPRKTKTIQPSFTLPTLSDNTKKLSIAIVGAGVAGLSCAYALAMRGHKITLIDKTAPLAEASGNPRAFLAPKLTSLQRMTTNLHAIGYLAGSRFYQNLAKQSNLAIFQQTGCLDLLSHNRIELSEVNDFPMAFAQLRSATQAENLAGVPTGEAIFLEKAGLIHTQNFAKAVLTEKNIQFIQDELLDFYQQNHHVILNFTHQSHQVFDHVIICTALDTCQFLPNIRPFNYSRGQVSWFAISSNHLLPKLPLKYGGYCTCFDENKQAYFLMGASFVRDTLDTTAKEADHLMNIETLKEAVPELANNLNVSTSWHGRAGLRSQTVDYLPLVGQVGSANSRVWTFSALGSKGYAYAPICSELLAGLICGEILPLGKNMLERLYPNRKSVTKKI